MALLAPADFRPSTGGLAAHEAVGQHALTAAEAGDADLTATIARMTVRMQQLTGDDFEAATETLKCSPLYPYAKLWLPKRASAITQVATRDDLGTLTVQSASAYRANLSLNGAGTDWTSPQVVDNLELLRYGPGLTAVYCDPFTWPTGPLAVEVTGTFGWTTPPTDVLAALGMMVWNHYKPQRLDLGATVRITAGGETQEYDTEGATGLLEVDGILRRFDRRPVTVVG